MDNRSGRKFFLSVEKTAGEAINRWQLVKGGDKVAVGISGGKDSYVLLDILAGRRSRLPVTYDILAVHVKLSGMSYTIDRSFAENLCRELRVPFFFLEMPGPDPDPELSTPCVMCSRLRRKYMFDFCREQGCTKLALGHHRDDIIETFLMNQIFQGTVSSLPPKLSIFNGSLDIIRPLALLGEDRIREYAVLKNFSLQTETCPYENLTNRRKVREILDTMKKLNPDAASCIFKSMSNIRKEYLP